MLARRLRIEEQRAAQQRAALIFALDAKRYERIERDLARGLKAHFEDLCAMAKEHGFAEQSHDIGAVLRIGGTLYR